MEVEYEGTRILLDLGLPLTAGLDSEPGLPRVSGLMGGDPSLLGIIVSHGHPDHWGLVPYVDTDVPVFIGEATQRILREAAFFTPAGAELRAAGFLSDRQPFLLGPFTITPFLADHSAFVTTRYLRPHAQRSLFFLPKPSRNSGAPCTRS